VRKGKELDFSEYTIDPKWSKAYRVANALDFAATHYPKRAVSYPLLVKAIFGYAKMPKAQSKDVEGVKSCLQRARTILNEKYHRALISVPGFGVRASVDSTDALEQDLPKKAKRLNQARKQFIVGANLIDEKKIPANHPMKKWFSTSIHDVRRQIGSLQFEQKLLPPSAAAPNDSSSPDDEKAE
jgi:hypothetical protein